MPRKTLDDWDKKHNKDGTFKSDTRLAQLLDRGASARTLDRQRLEREDFFDRVRKELRR